MSPITVRPIFRVTIPAKRGRDIDLREGDLMKASILDGGRRLRPMEVVDRDAAADRIAANFSAVGPSSEDVGRSEDAVMADTIADIAQSRGERRSSDA